MQNRLNPFTYSLYTTILWLRFVSVCVEGGWGGAVDRKVCRGQVVAFAQRREIMFIQPLLENKYRKCVVGTRVLPANFQQIVKHKCFPGGAWKSVLAIALDAQSTTH